MPTKYFTIEEANNLLPEIKPLVARLVEKQAKIANTAQQIRPLLTNMYQSIASPETTELTQTFAEIEQLIAQIQAYGVILKNVNVGLLDFLADFNGRDVYLCWKHGEEQVRFYHDIHDGFNGRKPL